MSAQPDLFVARALRVDLEPPGSFLAPLLGGVEMVNIPVFPGNPDPVGFVNRLGDEVVPKLAPLG